jgi:GNAT superfamily N-acetyltransferase
MALTDVRIRPFRDGDESGVLRLLRDTLGEGPAGHRSAEFFRWKHQENPFGRSFMLLAESGDEIVGLRAFMRWSLRHDGRTIRAVRAVDTATHPLHQGRGIFSKLTRAAIEELRSDADLVFNTPNEKSLPGYLKMGWRRVGRVPVRVRVRRPIRFLRGLRSIEADATVGGRKPQVMAMPAERLLANAAAVADLLQRLPTTRDWETPRGPSYLRWRYAPASGLDYRAIAIERQGNLEGLAIFHLRPRGRLWESGISELIAPDQPRARSLLRSVVRSSGVDHLICSFPSSHPGSHAATREGFLPSPKGPTLAVNVLQKNLPADVLRLDGWALTLGDLEVF